MQLLFIDYTELVLKAYAEKRESNRLSQLLMHPTAAHIRQECLNVYNERTRRAEQLEENTLRAFFGVPPAGKNFGYVIERFNADKFRPLQSLIKGEIKNPSVITVELLAWLIDFTPRPLAYAQKILGNIASPSVSTVTGNSKIRPEQDQEKIGKQEVMEEFEAAALQNKTDLSNAHGYRVSVNGNKEVDDQVIKRSVTGPGNKKLRIVAITGLIMAVIFGGIYGFQNYQGSGRTAFGNVNGGCMYWAGDQYKQVPCNEDPGGRLILPLNEERMRNFKRITNEDTITENSIGVIYYLKNGGKIEYYTTGGNHPVYITRTLKVLSQFMFDNHLRKKEAASGAGNTTANE